MSESSNEHLVNRTELERRLEQMDDVVAQRCLAVLDAADAMHQQTEQQLDQLTTTVNQLAETMIQFAQNAQADRAEIRRIWEYLLSQHPNGSSGS